MQRRSDTLMVHPFQPTMVLVLGLFLAVVGIYLSAHMAEFGQFIKTGDIIKDYAVGSAWALGLWALLVILPLRERKALVLIWPAKAFVTLGLMLYYEQHYSLDAYTYFFFATQTVVQPLASALKQAQGESILRLTTLIARFTGPDYHAIKIVYSFIGLMGCLLFYRALRHFLRELSLLPLFVISFTPTIIFWSSILGKDPVNFFGVGLYFLGVCGWCHRRQKRYFIAVLLGMLIARSIRSWYFDIMAVPVALLLWREARTAGQKLAIYATVALGAAVLIHRVIAGGVFGGYTVAQLPQLATLEISGFTAGAGSAQTAFTFTSTWQMVLFWPLGAFSALFLPLFYDAHNTYMQMASIEPAIMLVLVLNALRVLRWRDLKILPEVTTAAIFTLLWLAMYAFVSYGNLGSAVRFRLQVTPMLLFFAILWGTPPGHKRLLQARARAEREQAARAGLRPRGFGS